MNLNIEKCFYDLAYIVSELDSLFALSITPADLHGFAGFLCAAPCRGSMPLRRRMGRAAFPYSIAHQAVYESEQEIANGAEVVDAEVVIMF